MVAGVALTAPLSAGASEVNWYRCNTHTHTGAPGPEVKTPPEEAAEWYREHGYNCIFITDHENQQSPERITDVGPINASVGKPGEFLVISGQEVGQWINESAYRGATRHLHVNALGVEKGVVPLGYPKGASPDVTPSQAYLRNFAEIRKAGGIPQVNHPNLVRSVEPKHLLPLDGPYLMEIWNAIPGNDNMGGVDETGRRHLSTEELWDVLLTAGRTVYGTATDDTHNYTDFDDPKAFTPGRAWVMVRAKELTRISILDSLRTGEFYATTGIVLDAYNVTHEKIALRIRDTSVAHAGVTSVLYSTRFIGRSGEVLATVHGASPEYKFRGDEAYVRAVVTDSSLRRAWTQPVFRKREGSSGPRAEGE
ncbi:MAG: hypothetical protein B7Y99_08610 [Caulobacterales bacterium 32-69-10]|nr:MAG: hypothetical protein B7Y99_08610 [Caulobacterales bacterium 32-69-10]